MIIELNDYWQGLINSCRDFLSGQKIKPHNFHYYIHTIELIAEYASQNGIDEYSPEVGHAFFDSIKGDPAKSQAFLDRRRQGIKKLNECLYGNDYWLRQPRDDMKYKRCTQKAKCPDQFSGEFDRFLLYLSKIGLKEITIEQYRGVVTQMLCDFAEQGAASWRDINAQMLIW